MTKAHEVCMLQNHVYLCHTNVSVPVQTVVWFACLQSLLCLWGLLPECEVLLCIPLLFPPYELHPDNRKKTEMTEELFE